MYRWSLIDLYRLKNYYKRLLANCDDITLQNEYQSTINNILEVLDMYHDLFMSKNPEGEDEEDWLDYIDDVEFDKKLLDRYGIFLPIVREFRDTFDGFDVTSTEKLQHINVSNNRLITMASSFYHHTILFDRVYERMAKSFKRRIIFTKGDSDAKEVGNTFPIYGTNEVFFQIGRLETIQDYLSIIHEFAHGLTCKINKNIMWDWEKYPFMEVDAMFFDLIGIDFLEDKLQARRECQKLRMISFKDYLYTAELICSKKCAFDELSEDDVLNLDIVLNYFQTEFGYSTEAAYDIATTRLNASFQYVVSYLVAVELYLFYLEDKDKALKILYKIIKLKNLTKEEYLNEINKLGIYPGRNIQTFFDRIAGKGDDKLYGQKL